MNIRRAEVGDAELLARLLRHVHDLHVDARPDFFKPYALTPELIADFHGRLCDEATYCLIGEVDGAAVGYILAQVVERPENTYTYARRWLMIDQMSVNPDARSKGYGETLMQAMFELAQSLDIEYVLLGVWAFNERAIAFYERQGFTPRDIRMEIHLERL